MAAILQLNSYIRELNLLSILLRLLLSMLFGGIVGLDRERKRRPAGFRTYMLVSLGAALTMLLGQYEYSLIRGPWAAISAEIGIKTDVARIGAQVINGIGFLGAGTILVTGRHEVKGLTTAAEVYAIADEAKANGYTLSEEEQAAIESQLTSLDLYAAYSNMNRNSYIAAV